MNVIRANSKRRGTRMVAQASLTVWHSMGERLLGLYGNATAAILNIQGSLQGLKAIIHVTEIVVYGGCRPKGITYSPHRTCTGRDNTSICRSKDTSCLGCPL
ncbi:hypothetical protein PISMIDRAFT_689942, partial [Pisolithus microcarpus 441]